jgi:predicted membrane protein
MTAGILVLAFNAGLLDNDYFPVVFSLPMLVVSIGFICLFSRSSWFFGIILMLIGGFFLMRMLPADALPFSLSGWAVFLIVVGIIVICNAIWGKHHYHREWRKCHKEYHKWHSPGTDDKKSGYIEYNHVFHGGKEKVDIKNFKGGEINSVFGGMELDLSDATLAEGSHYLELNSVFGGITIIVPVEWRIELRQTKVFGQFVDIRPKPEFEVDEKSLLIIEANSVFGGGEIKCK